MKPSSPAAEDRSGQTNCHIQRHIALAVQCYTRITLLTSLNPVEFNYERYRYLPLAVVFEIITN